MLVAMSQAASQTALAQISDDVVRIGVLTDLSSWGRDNSGPGSVVAAQVAVEEFGRRGRGGAEGGGELRPARAGKADRDRQRRPSDEDRCRRPDRARMVRQRQG